MLTSQFFKELATPTQPLQQSKSLSISYQQHQHCLYSVIYIHRTKLSPLAQKCCFGHFVTQNILHLLEQKSGTRKKHYQSEMVRSGRGLHRVPLNIRQIKTPAQMFIGLCAFFYLILFIKDSILSYFEVWYYVIIWSRSAKFVQVIRYSPLSI